MQPGLHLTLVSKNLSVGHGSPVYYKKMEVGNVQSYKLSEDKQDVETKIFIHPQYSHLVNEGTRFWNARWYQCQRRVVRFEDPNRIFSRNP